MEDHSPINEDHQQDELNEQRTRVIAIIAVILFFLLLGITVAYFTSSSPAPEKKQPEVQSVSSIVEKLDEASEEPTMVTNTGAKPANDPIMTETAQETSSQETTISDEEENMADTGMVPAQESKLPEEPDETQPTQPTQLMITDDEPSPPSSVPAEMETEIVDPPLSTPTQVDGQPMIELSVHQKIVNELKKRIQDQKITIENLEAEIASLKDDIRYRMMQLPKPKAITVGECTTLPVGTWKLTPDCEMELKKAIAKVQNMMEHVIAWEIIPRVDFQAYGGMSPELKQEGLASYRANEVILKLDIMLPEKVVKFKGFTLEDENKRGWKIKVYILESGLESY